jgi:hypothetical protein
MNKPIRPTSVAYRRCLKCSKDFLSQGAGNRICKRCHQKNAALGPISETQLAAQRGVKRMHGIPLEDPNSYESSFS